MKISEMQARYRQVLNELYSEGELLQVIHLVFEHVKKLSKIDLVTRKDEPVSEAEEKEFGRILSSLATGEPVQYVLGEAWFCGMKLKVNEHVLIPRQETEELVEWVVKDSEFKVQSSKKEILDVCTGSGCIALALKKELTDTSVTGFDISEDALAVAKENSKLNHLDVNFIKADIFDQASLNIELGTKKFDTIVSNPPYVLHSEKKEMTERVIKFEPHLALFVSNDNPLVFYNAISDFAKSNLKPGGKLYFEINEAKGSEVVELLVDKGFSHVVLKKDLNAKDRMIRASL